MLRINTPNRAIDLNGPGKDGWRSGNKAANINPTENSGPFMNMIQEELAAIPESVGMALDPANNHQVLEAIQRMIDAQSGNYALDTGAANAYVIALSPAIAAYSDGLTVRFKIVNGNTGASTLNAGAGAVALVNDAGGALVAGDAPAGNIATATYIAAAGKFYLTSIVASQTVNPSQLVNQSLTAFTTAGAGTAYTLTTPLAQALTVGERFRIKFHANSGSAPTLNRDGKGAKPLIMQGNSASTPSIGTVTAALVANQLLDVEYDGTSYICSAAVAVKPCFYTSGGATHVAGSNPIIFSGIALDSVQAYNTANGKYQPSVAGYYLFNVQAFFGAGDNVRFSVGLYKNGVSQCQGFQNGNTAGGGNIAQTSCVVYLNGSTDFVQAWSDYGGTGPNSASDLTQFSGGML